MSPSTKGHQGLLFNLITLLRVTQVKLRAIQAAIAQFQQAVTAGFNGSTPKGQPVDSQTTSWSVEIYSIHEDNPIYTQHYNAPELVGNTAEGVQQVDSDTIYRIGSISKLLTVYLYLINQGFTGWNDPVSKYIPEFAAYQEQYKAQISAGIIGYWDFNSITVGSIASQLSGFPRETAGSPDLDKIYASLGIPYVPPFPDQYTGAACPNPGSNSNLPCTRAQLLGNILAQSPGEPAYYGPGYSNVAYGVFAVILEDILGRNFSCIFEQDLVQALHLNGTYYTDAPKSQGIIPFNNTFSQYNYTIGAQAPSGQVYSTINDMRKIGEAMLSSSQLTPATTRQWFKPASFLSNPVTAVGAPWEIYQAPLDTKQQWMYTKNGAIGLYQSYLVLLPDYDVGITILCAGLFTGYSAVEFLVNTMTNVFVPALESAAHAEAVTDYSGTYTNLTSNSTITITDGGQNDPGLEVTQWITNGTDILGIVGNFYYGTTDVQGRLYPSGFVTSDRCNGEIQFTFFPYNNNATYDNATFSLYGIEWFGLYGTPYRGASPGQWIFQLDEQGEKAVSVNPVFLQTTLTRTS